MFCVGPKAPEDWRSPRSFGVLSGSGCREASWTAVGLYRFSPGAGLSPREHSAVVPQWPWPQPQPWPQEPPLISSSVGNRPNSSVLLTYW